MCARYTLRTGAQSIKDLFSLDEVPEMPARFNVAPTQEIPAITESREGERAMRMLRWGLIPHWAKDMSIGHTLINAKSETLAEKPAFRTAFERRRCLIPADGFFEWKEIPAEGAQPDLFGESPKGKGTKTRKQPYYITQKNELPFAFAGLWERWNDPAGHVVDSCTIITTQPNELVSQLHDRMPVILNPADFDEWLDRDEHDTAKLKGLLRPFPSDQMMMQPVNPVVGNPRIDTEECIEPISSGSE